VKLEREAVVRHGGPLARFWDLVVNVVRGRRIVECARCFGSGVQKVERLDWSPFVPRSEATCVITTCTRCHGVGAVWR
jgi:hypothetical protein